MAHSEDAAKNETLGPRSSRLMVYRSSPEPSRQVTNISCVHWFPHLLTTKSEQPRWRADHSVSIIPIPMIIFLLNYDSS
ncbi:hypothetical protein TNCV_5086481 [Trichonephila clavipes]|uniref:Uncharacterized protein n=1 Tax=Trichonephila clavipes TaxID=2585209 RepID=A0A8X6VGZ2_TRICX|nr:hypothetical protein TNCV_5086481 [Trichonephila clavipes]